MNIPIIFIISLITSFFRINAFMHPSYKGVGVWNLRGTSNKKYENMHIHLHIMPKQKCDNLKINWVKLNHIGPIVYKDSVEGEIDGENCTIIQCDSNYQFSAQKYSISITNIFGIGVSDTLNINRPIKNNCNQDIQWILEDDILYIKMNEFDYIFSRNHNSETINIIRLDHFIITQILGYLISIGVKDILQSIHILN